MGSGIAAAQEPYRALDARELSDFKTKLSAVSGEINTLRCSFEQTQTISLLAEEAKSAGTMTYKNPDKLSWAYTAPTEQAFIVNGKSIITVVGGNRTSIDASSSQMMQEMCKIIIAGLKGDTESLEKSFTTTYLSNGKSVKVEMVPRNKAMLRIFDRMDLVFDPSSMLVTTILLSEPSGDGTSISIINPQPNAAVDDSMFME